MDAEKITVNLTPVDLGKIDVLVGQGMFASRTDMIRAAIRRELSLHDDVVAQTVTRNAYMVGVEVHGRRDLERRRERGERIRAKVVGLVKFGSDVTPELADDVFEHIQVLGALRGPKDVLDRLAPKIDRGLSRD